MDKIKEVKEILINTYSLSHTAKVDDVAEQICQIFELKPDESRLLAWMERAKSWGKELGALKHPQGK